MTRTLPFLLLAACGGSADWTLDTWGEDFIETGITEADFADDCSVVFTSFAANIASAELIDGEGAVAASTPTALVVDATQAGPHSLGTLEVPSGTYDTVRYVIEPATAESVDINAGNLLVSALVEQDASYIVGGILTCGGEDKEFDLAYGGRATYSCEAENLTFANNGSRSTQLTLHGDHFFYDGLTDEDAEVRGRAWFDADANADGVITRAELAGVDIAQLGYTVGPFSEVTDLDAFVGRLTQAIGHIDGEGHCDVTRE